MSELNSGSGVVETFHVSSLRDDTRGPLAAAVCSSKERRKRKKKKKNIRIIDSSNVGV
jgi:hypothetical protein